MYIKIEELRVGNIVGMNLKKYPDNYFKVLEIGETMKLQEYDSGKQNYYHIEDLEGISLKTAILAKCNFVQNPHLPQSNACLDMWALIMKNEDYLVYETMKGYHTNGSNDESKWEKIEIPKWYIHNNYEFNFNERIIHSHPIYLHQLQNVYYSISGIELKIKL